MAVSFSAKPILPATSQLQKHYPVAIATIRATSLHFVAG
jgi:hypothetical protein